MNNIDKLLGDKYLEQISHIIKNDFKNKEVKNVEIAPEYEDRHNNTDMFLYLQKGEPIRIGVRVRRYHKYNFDVTIRAVSKNNRSYVEWEKIKEGKGDYLIFAREAKTQDQIDKYMIIDLDILREFTECSRDAPTKSSIRYNTDGSGFVCYNALLMYEYDPRVIFSCSNNSFKNFILCD